MTTIDYPEIGICGLSCRLCPANHAGAKSWCNGCKREKRMAVGCPFLSCALKKKGVEFCWDCPDNTECERWRKHRDYGKRMDSFKCYQTLEKDITFIQQQGIAAFDRDQKKREELLTEMLQEFNEGRSKSYYCIAASLLTIEELQQATHTARKKTTGLNLKEKARVLHGILDDTARTKHYHLKIRKQENP